MNHNIYEDKYSISICIEVEKRLKLHIIFFIYSCDVQMHLFYMKAQCSLPAAVATLKLAHCKNLSLKLHKGEGGVGGTVGIATITFALRFSLSSYFKTPVK